MTNVEVRLNTDYVWLISPYNPALPARAKSLGGKFSSTSKAWYFDKRDEERVCEIARDIYGTDGRTQSEPMLTIKVKATQGQSIYTASVFVAGREIARAFGRESGAKLGEGVIQLEGRIKSSGSVKNWYTDVTAGSVFEIRDIPKRAVDAYDFPANGWEIVPETDNVARCEALKNEKSALLLRIEEINAELIKISNE